MKSKNLYEFSFCKGAALKRKTKLQVLAATPYHAGNFVTSPSSSRYSSQTSLQNCKNDRRRLCVRYCQEIPLYALNKFLLSL